MPKNAYSTPNPLAGNEGGALREWGGKGRGGEGKGRGRRGGRSGRGGKGRGRAIPRTKILAGLVEMNKHILIFCRHRLATGSQFVRTKTLWQYFDEDPLTGQKSRFSTYIWIWRRSLPDRYRVVNILTEEYRL